MPVNGDFLPDAEEISKELVQTLPRRDRFPSAVSLLQVDTSTGLYRQSTLGSSA